MRYPPRRPKSFAGSSPSRIHPRTVCSWTPSASTTCRIEYHRSGVLRAHLLVFHRPLLSLSHPGQLILVRLYAFDNGILTY